MSVVETIKSVLPVDGTDESTEYVCQECGNTFETADSPEEAQCMRCISANVEPK